MDFLNTVNFPNIFRYCKDLSKNVKNSYIERPDLTNRIISVLNKKIKIVPCWLGILELVKAYW